LGKAADRPRLVNETTQDLTVILRESDRADAPRRALGLLAADQVMNKLSQWLIESSPNGERESGEAAGVRRLLAPYGVKLGGMTHYGGLAYRHELLERVWRQWPETEAGELAFLEIQGSGWNLESGEGCPKNPDLFRDVIAKAKPSWRVIREPTSANRYSTHWPWPMKAGGPSRTRPKTTSG
jgi:hypothetical protein